MLYAKIYLDKDEEGRDLLVFDSSQTDDGYKFKVAGEKKTAGGRTSYRYYTTIFNSRNMAISEEAKAKLLYKIDKESKVSCFEGDFELTEDSFQYVPKPFENGQTKRTLADGEMMRIETGHGVSFACIDKMTVLENELLKNLDISSPVDEASLLRAYFESRRERGLDTACNAETIRRVPIESLTDEQRNFIKTYYRNSCEGYDSQDWHYHGDFIYQQIITEMASHFSKYYSEIESIING